MTADDPRYGPCRNDTNGDGDCAACARNSRALCRVIPPDPIRARLDELPLDGVHHEIRVRGDALRAVLSAIDNGWGCDVRPPHSRPECDECKWETVIRRAIATALGIAP